jgi:hypothetical protein
MGKIRVGCRGLAHLKFHVGLAGSHPHVAHQHIGERDGLRSDSRGDFGWSAIHNQLERAARASRLEVDAPSTNAAGLG